MNRQDLINEVLAYTELLKCDVDKSTRAAIEARIRAMIAKNNQEDWGTDFREVFNQDDCAIKMKMEQIGEAIMGGEKHDQLDEFKEALKNSPVIFKPPGEINVIVPSKEFPYIHRYDADQDNGERPVWFADLVRDGLLSLSDMNTGYYIIWDGEESIVVPNKILSEYKLLVSFLFKILDKAEIETTGDGNRDLTLYDRIKLFEEKFWVNTRENHTRSISLDRIGRILSVDSDHIVDLEHKVQENWQQLMDLKKNKDNLFQLAPESIHPETGHWPEWMKESMEKNMISVQTTELGPESATIFKTTLIVQSIHGVVEAEAWDWLLYDPNGIFVMKPVTILKDA